MAWERVIGQQRVKGLLRSMIEGGRIPHALLFIGPPGVGKDAAAIELARAILCPNPVHPAEGCGTCQSCRAIDTLQHQSLHLIFALPTGKNEDGRTDPPLLKLSDQEIGQIREELARKAIDPYHDIQIPRAQQIKISSIRELRREVSKASRDSGGRVIIVSEADMMRSESANAFLKTLEEPTERTFLILTSSRPEHLLATITSRCQTIRFDRLAESEIVDALLVEGTTDRQAAGLAAHLADGSLTRGRELLDSQIAQERFDVLSFLRSALRRSPVAAHAEIERITAGGDRVGIERVLGLLLIWLRDLLQVRITGSEDGVINSDQIDDIRSFLRNFPEAPLPDIIEAVEQSIYAIRRNGQPSLVMTVLAMRIIDACFPPIEAAA